MRTQTIEKTFLTFEELDDASKARALDEHRHWNVDVFDWWDAVEEDFKRVAACLGVEVDRIMFSGFWSQGDGASFEGSYSYRPGWRKALAEYAPQDEKLVAIGRDLQAAQRRRFYRLHATISQSGRYVHEYTMSPAIYDDRGHDEMFDLQDEEALTEAFRDLARWLYRALESEYEYLTSDDAVAESLIANEVEFDRDNGYDPA